MVHGLFLCVFIDVCFRDDGKSGVKINKEIGMYYRKNRETILKNQEAGIMVGICILAAGVLMMLIVLVF